MCFRSEAEIFCPLLSALQDPIPVRFIFGSLSFICCLVVLCSPSSRLSFLLFRRWGNTNRIAVCGSPCVFFLPTLHVIDPYIRHRISPRPPPRTCFFFVLVVWFRCRRLALSLSLWFRSPVLCMRTLEKTMGWPIRRRPHR